MYWFHCYAFINPSNTLVAPPVMSTGLSDVLHAIVSDPPSISTRTVRPVFSFTTAATAVAQAPVPQACVMPDPRSQTRILTLSSLNNCKNYTFVRWGK